MAEVSLSEYLSTAACRRWVWGEFDCLLFLADWVGECSGIDPAGEYRGAYDDERSARNLIKLVGGIEALVDECCERAGFFRTKQQPCCGDVGLVRVAVKQVGSRVIFGPVGAICIRDGLWAMKPTDGAQIIAQDFPLVRAWSPHG